MSGHTYTADSMHSNKLLSSHRGRREACKLVELDASEIYMEHVHCAVSMDETYVLRIQVPDIEYHVR